MRKLAPRTVFAVRTPVRYERRHTCVCYSRLACVVFFACVILVCLRLQSSCACVCYNGCASCIVVDPLREERDVMAGEEAGGVSRSPGLHRLQQVSVAAATAAALQNACCLILGACTT